LALEDRMRHISDRGEKCELYATGPSYGSPTNSFSWLNPPPIYLHGCSVIMNDHHDAIHQIKKTKVTMSFDTIIGNWRFGLFLRSQARKSHDPLQFYREKAKLESAKTESFSAAVQSFEETETVPRRLRDYMYSLIHICEEQSEYNSVQAPGVSLFSSVHRFHSGFSKSIYALDSASRIYSHLVQATISLKLIARPLPNSAWFSCLFERWESGLKNTNP
jgi:hypothetical protein